ncbi:hypothetical protein LT330_002939 [Penicillium expansum]|nr:hypothetical protein LT330_002939 [Penicillium expansum]
MTPSLHCSTFSTLAEGWNPRNWTATQKWTATCLVTLLAGFFGAAAPIDSPIIPNAAKEFHVSELAEALSVGVFLVGFGFGPLLVGPVPEVLSRSVTYLLNIGFMLIWLMASELAPNFGAQLVFRFLAGFSELRKAHKAHKAQPNPTRKWAGL